MQNIESIIEEIIKNGREKMKNPKLYWISSSYFFKGIDYFERGWLLIDEKKNKKRNIIGEIDEFHDIPFNKKRKVVVEGFVEEDNKILALLKIIPYSRFFVYYFLKKSEKGISGVYNGRSFIVSSSQNLKQTYFNEIGKVDAIIEPSIKSLFIP